MTEIRLVGGPFDGQVVEMENPRGPLVIEGDGVPEGMVARYRPTRERGVLRFREYDVVVARLPLPGLACGSAPE